jgi:hypothetical protein
MLRMNAPMAERAGGAASPVAAATAPTSQQPNLNRGLLKGLGGLLGKVQ